MNKIIQPLLIVLLIFTITGSLAQINITTKLEMAKPLGEAVAKEFQTRIFKAAISGKLIVYKDDSLTRKMTSADIKDKMNNDEVIQVYPDPNDPGFSVDSVIKSTLTEKDISGFLACAIFSPDSKNRQYSVQYRAFAISVKMSKAGYDLGEQPIFWFSAASLQGLLNAPEIEKFRKAIRTSTEIIFYDENPATGNTIHQLPIKNYIGKNALLMFNRKLFFGLLNGKLPGYADNAFTTSMKPDEIAAKPGQKENARVGDADTIYYKPLQPDSIYLHFMSEVLNFDETRLAFSVSLQGMAQGYDLIDNFKPKPEILSWIKFTDLARFLGETEYSGLIAIIFKATRDQMDVYSGKD